MWDRIESGRALSLSRVTRWPRMLGYAAILVLAAAFGLWSWIAPLASAALAPAVVSPDGSRKTVQHLEGGIVAAIHVKEGQLVSAGEILVTLDDVQARSKYLELRERYVHLLAVEGRLLAEQFHAIDIVFPDELMRADDADVQRVMNGQIELRRSRLATLNGREQILTKRIRQLEEEIAGLHEVISAQKRQLALIDQEIVGVQKLYDAGIERLPRLLALKRTQAEIEGQKAEARARVARNEQQIGETEMQLLTMREQDIERVNEELAELRRSLAELRSQMPSRHDVLSRTAIRAPISGTVMNIQVTTESGVISAGQPILDIVPAEAKLVIDAQVKPTDVDNVRPGMNTRVLLTAYRQRTLPQIHGTVRSVSADSLTESRSGRTYYLTKVDVRPEDLAGLDGVHLVPGMPAEVIILNGEWTLVNYLLTPLLESLTKSFRER